MYVLQKAILGGAFFSLILGVYKLVDFENKIPDQPKVSVNATTTNYTRRYPTMVPPNLTTFQICHKIPPRKVYEETKNVTSLIQIASELDLYQKKGLGEILDGTEFQIPEKVYVRDNSFVHAVVDAYNNHYNLVIRPDDIWGAIMTQFSFHVNAHAEEFRGQFVNFEGKRELKVKLPGTLKTVSYGSFVQLMSKEIDKNLIDGEVKEWILPNFSTTTQNDRVTSGVIFMAVMKKYFKYTFSLTCRVPNISLDGTIQDWKNIKNRISKLRSYKLEKWAEMLESILDQFIQAKSGQVNDKFWQSIVNIDGGSGPDYLSGWISTFSYFNEDGKIQGHYSRNDDRLKDYWPWPIIDTKDISSGIVNVDVKIVDHGMEYKAIMLAGHMAVRVLDDDMTIQPVSGWIMALKKDQNERESNESNEFNQPEYYDY